MVHYRGANSQLIQNEVGAPQGSVLSPFLFLVLVADIEECIKDLDGVWLLSYADDTTIYVVADSTAGVYKALEEAGNRVLKFMAQSGLAANPEKTKFVLFGKHENNPGDIRIGNACIPCSQVETLVGVNVASNLKWDNHLENLGNELAKRIGILRRLSWHLPKATMKKCISPVFTSKLSFALELITDPMKHSEPNQPRCPAITRLQRLQNEAMRAALRLSRGDRISERELLQRCGQTSVTTLAMRAIANHAWNSLARKELRTQNELARRIDWGAQGRATRQTCNETIPPQAIQGTLVDKIVRVWNVMPKELRQEQNKFAAKKKIKSFFT